MSQIAFYIGNVVIYWSGLIISLGIAAGFFLSYALYTAHSGRGSALWVTFGFSLVLGILFGRIVHYYFNPEQYRSLFHAITDFSNGSFFLPAAVLAVFPSAWIVRAIHISDSNGELLDALAPGLALMISLIRFSALFSNSCRSMFRIRSEWFQFLPFAVTTMEASGSRSYHFATFFMTAILMMGVMVACLVFYYCHHADHMKRPCPRYGHTASLFFILYFSIEIVMDSTRSDSTVLRFRILQFLNKYVSFISLTQVVCAVGMLVLLLRYMSYSRTANGSAWYQTVLLAGYGLGVAGAATAEYLVQRFTNRAGRIYLLQSFSVLVMAGTVLAMYATCRRNRKKIR